MIELVRKTLVRAEYQLHGSSALILEGLELVLAIREADALGQSYDSYQGLVQALNNLLDRVHEDWRKSNDRIQVGIALRGSEQFKDILSLLQWASDNGRITDNELELAIAQITTGENYNVEQQHSI